MIREVLQVEELISVPGHDDSFVDANSKRFDGISLTTVLMKQDSKLYVIAQSKNLKLPIVCKVNPRLEKLKFVRISSTLRLILCVSEDSKYELIDVSPFVNFVKPRCIHGFLKSEENKFSLEALGFEESSEKPIVTTTFRYSPNSKIIDAFWREQYIVFAEANGIHVVDVTSSEGQAKFLAVNDITSVSFSADEKDVFVAAFSNAQVSLIRVSFGGEVAISVTTQKSFPCDPVYAQCGLCKQWLLAILTKDKAMLKFDKDWQSTKHDLKGSKQFLLTRCFLWLVTEDGLLKVKFLKGDGKEEVILRNVVSIELVSDDEIMVKMKNSVAIVFVKAKDAVEIIFTNLIFENKFNEAVYIGEGMNMQISKLFQYVINKYVKEHNLKGAMRVLEHPNCDARDSLSRILQEGNDRLAWDLALRCSRCQRSVPLIQQRVTLKYSVFNGFMFELSKIFQRKQLLVSPEDLPLSLRFRTQMELQREEMDEKVLQAGSTVDFPKRVVFSFSQSYIALLRQLSAMKDILEEEIDLPPCLSLQKHIDSWVYMSHTGRLSLATDNIEVASFCIRNNTLFIIADDLRVYKTELPRIDMINVDMPRALKMATNGTDIVFLSVAGPIFYEEGEAVIGSFVDVAMGRSAVFGLGEDGVIYKIVAGATEKLRTKEFITAIAAAGDCVAGLSTKGNIAIIPPGKPATIVDPGFKCDVLKSIGDKAVIAGAGHLMSISESGEHSTGRALHQSLF